MWRYQTEPDIPRALTKQFEPEMFEMEREEHGEYDVTCQVGREGFFAGCLKLAVTVIVIPLSNPLRPVVVHHDTVFFPPVIVRLARVPVGEVPCRAISPPPGVGILLIPESSNPALG